MAGWLTLQLSGVSFVTPGQEATGLWLPHLGSRLSGVESGSGPPAPQALLATMASSRRTAHTIFEIERVHIPQGTKRLKIRLKGWG